MKSQEEQENPERKKLNILFSVDDIHPEIGYGLLKNSDRFRFLKKLHDEFGLKFTLFLVPIWHGKQECNIQKHKDWIQWIQSQGFYEIAAHGLFHQGSRPELGAMELINIPRQRVFDIVQNSRELFLDCGIDVRGFKTPGWEHPKEVYTDLKTVGFEWIADHFLGETSIKLSNGIVQIPYNCNTEELQIANPRQTAIFHSHISPKEGNRNGWTEDLYNTVRAYLLELQKTSDFNCLNMSEFVESEKNAKNVESYRN
ncbi:MAG: DUF2334 domain-containing protein [bacterium]|nr:DUF2334 domain-containing protein [bacterium]